MPPPRPALLYGWLTPVYDLFARLFIPEQRLKRALIATAGVKSGHRVLDLGAGTGTLAIMIQQTHPGVQVVGLDSDPAILALARAKASRAAASVRFDVGTATALPYPNQSFDCVLSSLVFSLLSLDDKRGALREAHRVLVRGGELHLADFGPPHTRWARWVAPRMRRFEPIAANLDGLLPGLFREAGFTAINAQPRFATLFGSLWLISGGKPANTSWQ